MKPDFAASMGEELGPCTVVISREQTRDYARQYRFESARFSDDERARRIGLPGIIVPGNMSLAYLVKLVTDWIGTRPATLVRLSTTYRQLVRPDSPLTLHGVVTSAVVGGPVELDLWLENEGGERLVTGTATVRPRSA